MMYHIYRLRPWWPEADRWLPVCARVPRPACTQRLESAVRPHPRRADWGRLQHAELPQRAALRSCRNWIPCQRDMAGEHVLAFRWIDEASVSQTVVEVIWNNKNSYSPSDALLWCNVVVSIPAKKKHARIRMKTGSFAFWRPTWSVRERDVIGNVVSMRVVSWYLVDTWLVCGRYKIGRSIRHVMGMSSVTWSGCGR